MPKGIIKLVIGNNKFTAEEEINLPDDNSLLTWEQCVKQREDVIKNKITEMSALYFRQIQKLQTEYFFYIKIHAQCLSKFKDKKKTL